MDHPVVEAEWLKALFPNSSMKSPEVPEFESRLSIFRCYPMFHACVKISISMLVFEIF